MSQCTAPVAPATSEQPWPHRSPRPWEKTVPTFFLAPLIYFVGRVISQVAFFFCMKVHHIRLGPEPSGGYVLACTHLSHLEPLCATALTRRRIHWMARLEFFSRKSIALGLRAIDAFAVNRFGTPIKALRTAIQRAKDGQIIGVFPEGGVAVGGQSVIRGGPIKRGACMACSYAGVPIVPCVILGTDKLNRVRPWLPTRSGKLWVIFGKPIFPRPHLPGRTNAAQRRNDRAALASELQEAFIGLYAELRQRFNIDDRDVP